MLETTSRLKRTVVLIACLWTCSFRSCGCSNQTVCEYTESYDEVVTVSVNELVHVTKNKWCLSFPPRCPDNKEEFRIVQKNMTVPKTRVVKKCCENNVRLYNDCIPKCAEKQCPNIQCAPDADKCECKPGYIGHLCTQTCGVGRWGPGCENSCHAACSDCDHRTGCCMTAWTVRGVQNRTATEPLTFCADRATATPTPEPWTSPKPRTTPEAASTTTTEAQPSATVQRDATSSTTVGRENGGGGPYAGSVTTTVVVKMYRYGELAKKLVWIFAMTVAAIAMVFVIMFVVFFNCGGASGASECGAKNRRRSVSAGAADPLIHETCIGDHKLGHVTLDRNTMTPGPRTSANNDLPIHPEIFCPVFSAPHYTNHYANTRSSLYDSPQPLYEILY